MRPCATPPLLPPPDWRRRPSLDCGRRSVAAQKVCTGHGFGRCLSSCAGASATASGAEFVTDRVGYASFLRMLDRTLTEASLLTKRLPCRTHSSIESLRRLLAWGSSGRATLAFLWLSSFRRAGSGLQDSTSIR